MEAIRGFMGGVPLVAPHMSDEQRRLKAEQQRLTDELRLLRIDAGIPDRRQRYLPVHPNRRRTDPG